MNTNHATKNAAFVGNKNKWILVTAALCVVVLSLLSGLPQDYIVAATTPSGASIAGSAYLVRPSSAPSVDHDFRIVNLRPQSLRLVAQPSCGCVDLSWRSATIPALLWKDIHVTVRAPKGDTVETVAFQTSEPKKRFMFVYIGNRSVN